MKEELKGSLSEEQLKKLKKECAESLARNRHKLLVDMPFIGSIAMRFDLIPVRDARCRTACTDSKVIYFDIDFYSKLTDPERVFVLAHETFHCLLLHFSRKQTRDQELFNIATDMEVNNALNENSTGKSYAPPKSVLFPPPKMKGKSAEVIYDWLLKQQQQNKLNQSIQQAQMSQSRSGYGNDDDEDDDSQQNGSGGSGGRRQKQNNKNGQQSNNQNGGSQEQRDQSQDGKHSGELKGQFDKHSYENDPTDDAGQQNNGNGQNGQKNKQKGQNGQNQDDQNGNGKQKGQGKSSGTGVTDQWGEVGYDEDFKPGVPEGAAERMREAVISAAQSYEREHGELPAGVDGIVKKLAKPEMNWRDELCNFVTSHYGGRRSYLPPNRRHVYNDMYFQSRRSEQIKIGVAIDTSGSCIGDLPKFFGELKGLVETFGSYEIHCMMADAAVDKYELFDDNNPLELDTAEDIQWSGGGGTDYEPVFKFVEKENLDIDCLVYLGDGYVGEVTIDPPPYPVLWLITKDGNLDFCKWGKKIRFKESSFE